MEKIILIKGNEAMAEGAVIAGCRYYFGYPITPQNEVPAYMAARLPEVGGVFIQAESELASINMVFGASAAGARVMTSTSSPGYSLMQEGISYLAGARLPCVLANVQRGGPGLGNIALGQADYFQAVKGGGHGDYHVIVLAPASPQEMMDLTILAFDLADQYRVPALILSDAIIGQMVEKVELRKPSGVKLPAKTWALTGAKGRPKNVVRSLWLDDDGVEINNLTLQDTYNKIKAKEVRFENIQTEDANVVIVAYGTCARIAKSAVIRAREKGFKAGLLRPITLYPFPYAEIERLIDKGVKTLLTVELSAGQMVEDVYMAAKQKAKVAFFGKMGGKITGEDEIFEKIADLCQGKENDLWHP